MSGPMLHSQHPAGSARSVGGDTTLSGPLSATAPAAAAPPGAGLGAAGTTSGRVHWPVAGVGAAITGLAGLFMSGAWTYPTEAARDDALVVEHLVGKEGAVWAFQALITASALLLVVFAAGLRGRLARQEPVRSLNPTLVMAGLLLVSAMGLVGAGMGTQQFFSLLEWELVDPDAIVAMQNHIDTLAWVWAGAGLAAAAVAHAALRHGSLPRWIGWVSAVFAVVILGVALAPIQYMTGIVGGLWLLVVSIGLAVARGVQD